MLEKRVLDKLATIVGKGNVFTLPEDLVCYSYDATPTPHSPDAVALPDSAQRISAILKLANEKKIPVVPRGAGTNLSGGTIPIQGGIVLPLTRMNRILELDEDNLTATVQPGLVLADFQREVEGRGLFYPPDPGSLNVATMGGTVSEDAGGPRGAKYGTTKDYVKGLQVVLPTGEIIRTGGKTIKNVSGYDLTHLLVGAEGTLGVITEITVRLLPLPEAKLTCLAIFNTIDEAAEAVSAIVRNRIVPASLELMDDVTISYVEAYKPVGLPRDAGACLLIDVDGSAVDVPILLEKVSALCRQQGAREVRVAKTKEESDALWAARRIRFAALARARPTIITEDATVPRPLLPKAIRAFKEAAREYNVQVGFVAHAGDGNIHPGIMCDARDAEEMGRVQLFIQKVFKTALELKGTLSGEHGIGLLKSSFLPWQHGDEAVEAMRRIKRALDPNDILNPGKIFPG
ncbi:MAG: FAD-binding protein [Chloroflexi bacterium]|nr:FAD-binding protein [Chloroflexota bacterium]